MLLEQRNGNITEVDPGCPVRSCHAKKEEETTNETEKPIPGSPDSRSDADEKNGTACECRKKELTRWDILYSEEFFNRTLTENLLEQITSYWDILGMYIACFITK